MENFNLAGALQAGYSKQEIAQNLASMKNFDYAGASKAGYSDAEIISNLLGAGALDAFTSQFEYNAAESALGIAQAADWAGANTFDKERAKAMSDAADILSEGHGLAKWTGIIGGSIADPIGIPAKFLKFVKAATMAKQLGKQGIAQGMAGGILQPSYADNAADIAKEKATNTVVGGVFGGLLGAGIGKSLDFLSTRASGKAEQGLTDQQKAADDAIASVVEADAAIASKAETPPVDYNIPAWQRKTEGTGVEASKFNEPPSPETIKLLEDRLTEAQARVAKTEESLFELNKQQPEKQVAALLRKPEGETPTKTGETPTQMGLVEPSKGTPEKQIAALFRTTPVENKVVREEVKQTAFLLDRKKGLENELKLQQAEVDKVQQLLNRIKEQPTTYPITTPRLDVPTSAQVAARDARLASVYERTGREVPKAPEQPATPVAQAPVAQAPVAPPVKAPETQTPAFDKAGAVETITKAMEQVGAKNTDELIVKTGTPDEVKAAQARIDKGETPKTVQQLVDEVAADALRGVGGSLSSAAAKPEQVFADTQIFPNTNATIKKLIQGKTPPPTKREEVAVPELEKQLNDFVGFLNQSIKKMAPNSTFESMMKNGKALIKRARDEEGSFLNWLFKQDDKGNFTNAGPGWTAEHIAAFAPVVKYANDLKTKLLDDAADLKRAGKFDKAAKEQLANDLSFPIQVLGLFQAKRSEASQYLNSFRLMRKQWEGGGEIKGFIRPRTACN